jgi:predicted MFS family arabinose efflux permease
MPASQTISSEIVPPKLVGEAVHLNVVAYQAARAIGPLCAGFVLARWGVQWAFAIDAISYLVALMTLLSIRSNSTPSRSGLHTWTFRQTWRMPGVAIGVVATAVIALFGPPIVQLTAVLADVSFKVDASGYGLLLGSYGFGSFAGALVLSLTAHRMRKSRVVTLSAIVFGLSLIALSATDQFAIGLFAIALAGSCFSISLGSLNSGIQTSATHNARGKAVGLYLISLNGAAAVGALAAGWASGHAAVTTVVAVLGSALAFGTILLFSSRRLTALDVVPERGAPVIQQAR